MATTLARLRVLEVATAGVRDEVAARVANKEVQRRIAEIDKATPKNRERMRELALDIQSLDRGIRDVLDRGQLTEEERAALQNAVKRRGELQGEHDRLSIQLQLMTKERREILRHQRILIQQRDHLSRNMRAVSRLVRGRKRAGLD